MNLLPDNMVDLSAATIDRIDIPAFNTLAVSPDLLRLDKIHPVISGNKWFKLKYYLEEALEKNYQTILTFGGAYSNHIAATAYAAERMGMKSIGIIRGEEPAILSHTLKEAKRLGMQLSFINRETYRQKKDTAFIKSLSEKYAGPYIIPEGGEGEPGIRGAAEIADLVDINKYSHLLCAVGTGTLLKGLARASLQGQQVIGIPVLKGFIDIPLITDGSIKQRVRLIQDYHFGGYAKNNETLFAFMNEFYDQTNIPTDFVYTGKLLFAAADLAKKNYFPAGSQLLLVHSGGLQGNDSLAPQTLNF
jgi:1-aminocyclopropane-1-carboxylate deaminase